MNPQRLMTIPCTVTTPASADTYDIEGQPDPASPATVAETVCWLHQRGSSEDTVNTDQQALSAAIWLPVGTTVTGHSIVTIYGDAYQLDGPPNHAYNPRLRAVSHIECPARRVV